MKAIICDKCGEIQPCTAYSATVETNRHYLGESPEIHLCSKCTEDLIKWIKTKEEKQ